MRLDKYWLRAMMFGGIMCVINPVIGLFLIAGLMLVLVMNSR